MSEMKKTSRIWKNLLLCFLALLVPLLLVFGLFQNHRYKVLRNEVDELDSSQYETIDSNRRLVSDISQLAGSEKIEQKAVDEYGMQKIESEEIIRIKVGTDE